jgi:hypothetical protein
MSDAETFLDVFDPPEGMVGHSAALVAMTGKGHPSSIVVPSDEYRSSSCCEF